jgi:hypothetical protein
MVGGILAIIGGSFAVIGKHHELSLIGGAFALIDFFPLGIPALILIAVTRDEFDTR